MSKKNTSVLWSVDQSNSLVADDRARAQKNIGLSTDFVKSVGANNFVSGVSYDNNKNLQLTSSELNLSAIKVTTPDRSVVTDNSGNVVVNDLSTSTPSASGTATSFISAISQNSIGKLSSISKANLPEASTSAKGIVQLGTTSSTAAAGDHSHGNITKGGELTSSVASASSQYLVITEASNNKVARSSLAFDTSNGSNKILKKTGAWGDFIGTSATTAAAGNHSHAADFGKFTHSTQETFNNANLSISSFAETIKQSSHITRNSSTGAITLDAGIYNIEYVLEVTIPESILSNQIGQLNGVEVDYTYIHSVTVTTSTISKYTSSTVYSIDIPSAADLLSGTKIAVNQLIITYIGGIV